jgi:hypothetical protein
VLGVQTGNLSIKIELTFLHRQTSISLEIPMTFNIHGSTAPLGATVSSDDVDFSLNSRTATGG